MWKNIVELGRPQLTVWRMCTFLARNVRLQMHILRIFNTDFFCCSGGCTNVLQCFVICMFPLVIPQ